MSSASRIRMCADTSICRRRPQRPSRTAYIIPETWHGRMKACRGVGASLNEDELVKWDAEHRKMLESIAPEKFEVLHYAALSVLKKI